MSHPHCHTDAGHVCQQVRPDLDAIRAKCDAYDDLLDEEEIRDLLDYVECLLAELKTSTTVGPELPPNLDAFSTETLENEIHERYSR